MEACIGGLAALLATEADLSPGHIVLDGDPDPLLQKGAHALTFKPISVVAKRSPISVTAELLLLFIENIIIN